MIASPLSRTARFHSALAAHSSAVSASARWAAEQAITLVSRLLLNRRRRDMIPACRQNIVRYAETAAELGYEFRLGTASGPQRMVDGRGFDLAWSSARREQQQGEAVRTARYGNA